MGGYCANRDSSTSMPRPGPSGGCTQPSLPMRLSPFNEGDNHQVVYFLSNQPLKFDGLETTFVKRQVAGWRMLKNVTAN